METIISKTFDFGKIAYNGNRRTCPAEVTLELQRTESGLVLSISGAIWKPNRSDCYACGQILDIMHRYLGGDPVFVKLYNLWTAYHLNDLNAGTARQAAALEKAGITEYNAACAYLKTVGLYVDSLADNESLAVETKTANRKHYEYGHGWITRQIPAAAVAEICGLCGVEPSAAA